MEWDLHDVSGRQRKLLSSFSVRRASGSWGCGAFCGEDWFQLQWPESLQDYQITVKELIPIVLAAAVWGKDWLGKNVMAYCDNSAVVPSVIAGNQT